ncbi:MAG: peptidylprolyl isomerase [Candidatus Gastranaerophilales bacterium]|nr:peptidylprolyl isomerase [Candidatus Gastranaerophilales bacterium]
MKFTKLALTLLCSGLLFCGCTKDMGVAIKVNDTVITKAEFNDEFNRIKHIQLKNVPEGVRNGNNNPYVLILKNKFVNDMIVRALLNQEFEKRKITASEEEIKAKKEEMVKHFGSQEAFDNVLKEHKVSAERLNLDMANEVKMAKLTEAIGSKKVTESDIQKFYKENKKEFTTPAQVKASHILFETNKDAIKRQIVEADKEGKLSEEEINKKVDEQYAKTQALIADIRKKSVANPKKFAEFAKEYSIDKGSAQMGGDLGFFAHEQMVPEFSNAAFSQKVGTISQPVKSQYGTHLIYVTDKKAARTSSLAELKADIKKFLVKKNSYEALQKLIDGLKASAKIEFVDASLKPEAIEKQITESLPKEIREQQNMLPPTKPEATK